MNELIKLTQQTLNDTEVNTVNARELHEFLEVRTRFNDWIVKRIEDYDFEGKGRLKIGISNNPEKRLKTLQTGSAEDLTLLYTSLVCSNSLEIEANVHEHFKEYLVRGEWFSSDLESQTYVLESDFDLSFGSKIVKLLKEKEVHRKTATGNPVTMGGENVLCSV